jgi:hypothetical protein
MCSLVSFRSPEPNSIAQFTDTFDRDVLSILGKQAASELRSRGRKAACIRCLP